ncbi:hypothetical protein [Variovorax sp. PAMC 28711]|uniref:hypothetical protein n=1 Tax=Variovorax sp. PAMC 28711 TaxID=1795631 RepID=UPI00078BD785|nr:hypothetical protein [Variovorax sp. PAMC 28711]AMM23178.1 hypothetical protein AX767_01405 [Variovorax sp. PAMC 28711]
MIANSTLNQVAALLSTSDKNTVLTVVIGTLVQSGMDVRDAIESVLGEGSYKTMAGQIYDALRAKA